MFQGRSIRGSGIGPEFGDRRLRRPRSGPLGRGEGVPFLFALGSTSLQDAAKGRMDEAVDSGGVPEAA